MSEEKKEKAKWTTVNLLRSTFIEVQKIITQVYGFSSVADYVAAAVRRKLDLDKARVQMEKDEKDYGS